MSYSSSYLWTVLPCQWSSFHSTWVQQTICNCRNQPLQQLSTAPFNQSLKGNTKSTFNSKHQKDYQEEVRLDRYVLQIACEDGKLHKVQDMLQLQLHSLAFLETVQARQQQQLVVAGHLTMIACCAQQGNVSLCLTPAAFLQAARVGSLDNVGSSHTG